VRYTHFPYLADEEDFEKFRKAGINIIIQEILETLDFVDLPQKSGNENETHRALKKLSSKMLKILAHLMLRLSTTTLMLVPRACK
jgi:hypothetical protein